MPRDLKEYKVFIASPANLQPERTEFRDVIEEYHRPEQSHLQDQHRITAISSDRTDFPIGTIELEAEKPLVYDSQGDVVEYRISQTGLQRPPRVSAGE